MSDKVKAHMALVRNHIELVKERARYDVINRSLAAVESSALALHAEQAEPVAAQHRFRRPEKGAPDWSPWQPCKVSNRPAWEIDSQGYEVEYRALCVLAARPLSEPPKAPVEPVGEREQFEAHFKHLDFTMDKDGWGRDVYVHPHVYSLWCGWEAARSTKGSK